MKLLAGSSLGVSIVLDMLVVIALYSVFYIVYLTVLQHPRKRKPIPTWKQTLFVLFLLLNVFACSMTVTGIDFPILITSSTFLLALGTIIGAPSFALRRNPHPQWEYLSRHSSLFIFGIFSIAIVISYWISNSRLNALVGTALLIELGWLFYLHSVNRSRQPVRLDEHSAAVLQKQAGDDLDGFIKKHRITEVVRAGDEIHWMGCTKHSPPCPINYYVNKIGLNTPPCCIEHMRELCLDVGQVLEEIGVSYWIDGGTLLGAVRENGHFLAWEDDVDVSFMLDDSMDNHAFYSELRSKLAHKGYIVRNIRNQYRSYAIYYTRPITWLRGLEQHRYRGEIHLDLVACRTVNSYGQKVMERASRKGVLPQTESGAYGVPLEMIMPTSEIQLLGGMIACPADAHAYLQAMYGDYTKADYTYVDDQAAASRKEVDTAK